ncbi:MAG TPA: VanZ family protein [Sphingobacteriaceae bacterium]|nr:VanZ family protein [Sphingobacteriaceae bacterium]
MRYYFLPFLWAIIVLILCLLPPSSLEGTPRFFEGADKVVHLGFFFVFSTLLFHAYLQIDGNHFKLWPRFFQVVLISVVFAALTELLQWKISTHRNGDWWDFFADVVGIGMASFSFLLLRSRNR